MKKGEVVRGKITSVQFPNKGIMIEEKPILIKGVIQGQTVEVRITKNRKDSAQASLVSVVERSYLENAKPLCSHTENCGGCFYQMVDYGNQLKIKENMVKDLLIDFKCESCYDGIIASPLEIEYRNKMELSFGDEIKGGELALGLHKKKSKYDIVNNDDCILMDEDFRKIREFTLSYFRKEKETFYHKINHVGYLRHLVIRKAFNGEAILVNLVTSSQKTNDLTNWVDGILSLKLNSRVVGIIHTVNDSLSDVVKAEKVNILYGNDFYIKKLLGLNFKVSAFSFFQTNPKGAELLYSRVLEYLGEDADNKIVFDLYSGTGTIAQLVSLRAKKVYGVEIVKEAVESAKENTKLNKLENCIFYAGDVLKCIDDLDVKPEFIIVDPPREGIHPKAITKILDFGVDNIIYISCKASSLKDDLKVMYDYGYRIKRWSLVDMFPQTVFVETVCLLSKLNTPKHIDLELTMDELDLTASENKATYQKIKDYLR